MKRYSKLLAILGLVLLLSLTVAGAASADVLRGEGWLYARGSGIASLQMSGTVEVVGHGVGMVYIRGAEQIEASGQGRRVDRAGGVVVFYGHEGTIHIEGEQMVVRMVGKKIEFTAEGKGRAWLRGAGTYETGSGYTGDWAPDGQNVEMAGE